MIDIHSLPKITDYLMNKYRSDKKITKPELNARCNTLVDVLEVGYSILKTEIKKLEEKQKKVKK